MRRLLPCAFVLLSLAAHAGVVSPVVILGPRRPLCLLATPVEATAAANWHKAFVQQLAETGLEDWRDARGALGLGRGSGRVRIKDGPKTVPLDRLVFGRQP